MQAEKHLVQAGDWKSAVNMYSERALWEDAHRVRLKRERERERECVYMCEYENAFV